MMNVLAFLHLAYLGYKLLHNFYALGLIHVQLWLALSLGVSPNELRKEGKDASHDVRQV